MTFQKQLGTIIPTDELTPSFFRGLGGSTTKHFTIFTMFSSHGGMTIPIRWCLQALFEDGIAMDARCLMERGQAWRQERLRGSNLTQDPPSRWWVQMIAGQKLGKWCGTMLDYGWHRIFMGFCGWFDGLVSNDKCFLFKRPSNFNDCLHALKSSMEMSPGPILWVTSWR